MSSSNTTTPKISHRGIGFRLPQNSLDALRAALSSNIQGVELDVRKRVDGVLVCAHLPTFSLTGLLYRSVKRLFGITFLSGHEMTLEEALSLYRTLGTEKRLFLDLKERGFVKELFEQLKQHELQKRVEILTFFPSNLKDCATYGAEAPRWLSLPQVGITFLDNTIAGRMIKSVGDLSIRGVFFYPILLGSSVESILTVKSKGFEVGLVSSAPIPKQLDGVLDSVFTQEPHKT
jgi:glycerophosphoryl diester phosphodiesterase